MEPISILTTAITAAITAGVTGGVKEVSKQAVLDAYGALKDAIKNKFGKDGNSATAINKLEESPDSKGWQQVLVEDISKEKIHEDKEIVKIARDLIAALMESESGQKALVKYDVDARGANVGVIGDNTVIHGDVVLNTPHIYQKTDAITQEDWENIYLTGLIERCDNLELTTIEESCTSDTSPFNVANGKY